MYVVFDILFVKGTEMDSCEMDIMGAKLIDRKQVLEKVVKEQPHVIEIAVMKECTSSEEVFECFNQSVKLN